MNRIYHGDNLAILQERFPDNSIDLIATDPPFNTGKDWGAFSDKWDGMQGYLKFMEPRCVEMHRVLKDTGSFYLHCDPTASHYLKVMLDGIFGADSFQNEIIWYYKNASRGKRRFAKAHDTLFWYSKTGKYTFNADAVRVPFESGMTAWSNKRDGKKIPNGKIPDDVFVMCSLNNMAKERIGYPTQKPIALYKRIIKASSNEGDTVLDPFAGSGTTLDAAQSLNRKWIGIDQNAGAIKIIEKRLTELFMKRGEQYRVIRAVRGV